MASPCLASPDKASCPVVVTMAGNGHYQQSVQLQDSKGEKRGDKEMPCGPSWFVKTVETGMVWRGRQPVPVPGAGDGAAQGSWIENTDAGCRACKDDNAAALLVTADEAGCRSRGPAGCD